MSENSSNISSKGLLVSIFKYSIATWANALIYGVALLLSARLILPAEYSQVDIFISTATLIMNICILGLDQSFIRFFNEPPKPLNKDSLFGACFGLSSLALIAVGIVSCVLFPKKVLGLFFTDPLDNYYLALLFINAFMSNGRQIYKHPLPYGRRHKALHHRKHCKSVFLKAVLPCSRCSSGQIFTTL